MEEGLNESSVKMVKFNNGLSDSVAQTQNMICQLKSNADTATVTSDKVRQNVEQLLLLKTEVNSIEKQKRLRNKCSLILLTGLRNSWNLLKSFLFINFMKCQSLLGIVAHEKKDCKRN